MTDEEFNKKIAETNLKIIKFFLEHSEYQIELADALRLYNDEYTIDCFQDTDIGVW